MKSPRPFSRLADALFSDSESAFFGDEMRQRVLMSARSARVHDMWREIMLLNRLDIVLDHTNNVYIIDQDAQVTDGLGKSATKPRKRRGTPRYRNDGKDVAATGHGKKLVVYVDDSAIASELNARREIIKLQFVQQFAEVLDEFEILISTARYRKLHPYLEDGQSPEDVARPVPLSPDELSVVDEQAAAVRDGKLREVFRSSMRANLEWHKGEGPVSPTRNKKR